MLVSLPAQHLDIMYTVPIARVVSSHKLIVLLTKMSVSRMLTLHL